MVVSDSSDATGVAPASTEAAAPAVKTPREDRLALSLDHKLREGVLVAFRRILDRALRQLDRADTEPAAAVHEFRKSVRRARALLALLRPSLKARRYDKIADHLRRAHRQTSGLRDADVLMGTLDRVEQSLTEADAREAATDLRDRLRGRRDRANPPGRAAEVLDQVAAHVTKAQRSFDKAVPKKLAWSDIERGLTRTLRRALRNRDRAQRAGRDDELHDWRKRTKELNYQVEFITRGSTLGPVQARKRFAALAEALGEITDLLVLRDAVEELVKAGAGAEHLAQATTTDIEARRTRVVADTEHWTSANPADLAAQLVVDARSARKAVRTAVSTE